MAAAGLLLAEGPALPPAALVCRAAFLATAGREIHTPKPHLRTLRSSQGVTGLGPACSSVTCSPVCSEELRAASAPVQRSARAQRMSPSKPA